MKTCIVTCTGGRPELFALCQKWVLSQTRQPDLWLVVTDNGEPEDAYALPPFARRLCYVPDDLRTAVTHNPVNRSLALALCEVPQDHAVVVMEDDDFYPKDYVASALSDIDGHGFSIVGSRVEHRYHLASQMYCRVGKAMPDCGSVALAPGFAKPYAKWLAERDEPFGEKRHYDPAYHRVAIRGAGTALPGRAGIGHEHLASRKWKQDHRYAVLRNWCGPAADDYLALLRKP